MGFIRVLPVTVQASLKTYVSGPTMSDLPQLPPDALAVYELSKEESLDVPFSNKLTPLRKYILEGFVPDGVYACARCDETKLFCMMCGGSRQFKIASRLLVRTLKGE